MKHISPKSVFIYQATIFFILLLSIGPAFSNDGFSDAAKQIKIESLYAKYKESFPAVDDISPEEVNALIKSRSVIFVDVREPEEQAVSMLPRAIPHRIFLQNPEAYRDFIIIGYCTISYRSGKLAQKLKKKGIQMINLRGGILAWLHAGNRIYKNGRPVSRVHLYGKKWDLAPAGYETVF